ncbi:glycine cleavage system H protein 2, mitochondrial-like [Gastrolobium bilobum]|uniref:glycine cleavage system H protein 2, mitochondrial-like n=1 Tax=Gastrolobium bilobum TaxID=150636 RepID=UPI002AB1205B|nr:glycine cleavage system H protein 2, mitochondrial-like [Gastrolobium bilobum]
MACSQLWASRAASYLRISVFHRGFSNVLKDLMYLDSHEWVKVGENSATVGITDHLGDAVYVELPEVGATVRQGGNFGAVESVKATSDINSVSGKIFGIFKCDGIPQSVNSTAYEDGWIIKVEMSNSGELNNLMDSDQYSNFCEEDSKH